MKIQLAGLSLDVKDHQEEVEDKIKEISEIEQEVGQIEAQLQSGQKIEHKLYEATRVKLFQSEVSFPAENQVIEQIQRKKVKVDKQIKSVQEMLNGNRSGQEVRKQLDRLLELYGESSICNRVAEAIESDFRRFQEVCRETTEQLE